MSRPLPAGFVLAAACSAWPPSERRDERIRAAAADVKDWKGFLRIVKRQRVQGLVHNALTQAAIVVPPEIVRELARSAAVIVRQNLHAAAETLRIQALFDQAAIPVFFVKGISLGQLAYGTPGLKQSWDIDLVVAPEDVPVSLRLLEDLKYRSVPSLTAMTPERYRRWLRIVHEHILSHETNAVAVEIHWRLIDNPHLLREVSVASPARIVMISGARGIRTLNDADLVVYLCVHGALHAWYRLNWLADVGALFSQMDRPALERRFDEARQSGAEHCMAQAIMLCDRLFALPEAGELAARLRLSARNRWLERIALWAMTVGEGEAELTEVRFGTQWPVLSHFALGAGWRHIATEVLNKSASAHDTETLPLPASLGFLYPILRIPLWIGRRIKDGGRLKKRQALSARPPRGPTPAS